ncbi:MAG: signal transduction histidine kinase [Planctomycetota bacterium]|jgi:signal transduction histidine kinase
MANVIIKSTESVQDCLFEGLRALREGQDPLLAGLAAARVALGANRSVWVSARPSESAVSVCSETRAYRSAELPDSLPPRWLEEAPRGRSRLIGPNWLRRDPRAVAAGLDWALVAQAVSSGGRLWIDSASTLKLAADEVGDLLRAMEELEQLSDKQESLRQAERLAQLGERAAGVAHDLRNQLALVQLEYRRMEDTLEHGTIKPFAKELEGALQLCRNFLSFEGPDLKERVNLRKLLKQEIRAASDLSQRAGEVRIAMRCPTELDAQVEEELLGRALRNLLLNAIAATPSGGGVKLEAKAGESGSVHITIADEGRGMNEAELERLLRAGESAGGTGFGTSSVLACVQAMAASMNVHSEPGCGTRFELQVG